MRGGGNSQAIGGGSTIGGGAYNNTSGDFATIDGGDANSASGFESTIGGGTGNFATGEASTVVGGSGNSADGDEGTFMWADSTNADFFSDGPNRFLVRASGGTAIYSDVGLTMGVTLVSGGSAWAAVSDRNLKENFAEVDTRAVLDRLAETPITTWNYKSQNDAIRHMGPMGQDFYAAFGIGEEETRITTIDADGVALAAIQGLHQIVQEKECELDELRKEKHALAERLAALERSVAGLLNRKKGD